MSIPTNATELTGSKNVMIHIENTTMHLYCDLSKDFGMSASGKTTVIASSSGNKPLGSTNAFLGLNVFCKDIASRAVPVSKRIGPESWTNCTCTVSGNILDISIDFSKAGTKEASSGKSVLLATSGGIKTLGGTGIMCGLNCYRPIDKELQLDKVCDIIKLSNLAPGQSAKLDDVFFVNVTSGTEADIVCDLSSVKDNTATMPPATICGAAAVLSLRPIKGKSGASEATDDGDKGAPTKKKKGSFSPLGLKSRGVEYSLADSKLTLRFKPSADFGLSSSGKSLLVATSGGSAPIPAANVQVALNIFKPAPPVTLEVVDRIVRAFIASQPVDEAGQIRLRAVYDHVQEELKLAELQERHKLLIRSAVKDHYGEILESQSQNTSQSQPENKEPESDKKKRKAETSNSDDEEDEDDTDDTQQKAKKKSKKVKKEQ